MKLYALIAIMAVLLAAAIIFAAGSWLSAGPVSIGFHGWTALTLGVVFSLALGGGLMWLVFYSSRSGHDDEVRSGDDVFDGDEWS